MSEPKRGPFADIIRRISVLVNDHGDGTDGWAWDQVRPILEVVGKVDKEHVYDTRAEDKRCPKCQAFRALLEALPDGGKK